MLEKKGIALEYTHLDFTSGDKNELPVTKISKIFFQDQK